MQTLCAGLHRLRRTLIDYNFRQTSFGAGVTLFGW
jgi:hypothetical protein